MLDNTNATPVKQEPTMEDDTKSKNNSQEDPTTNTDVDEEACNEDSKATPSEYPKAGEDNSASEEDDSENGDEEMEITKSPEDDKEIEIPTRFTRSGRRRATPFPVKLMKVLSMKEFRHIIAWTPSGKAFTIMKPKLFTVDVLPTYFKSAKYSSFTRKLHRWGYMRHYRGPEAGAFYHKEFHRGDLERAEKMTCYKPESMRPPSATVKKTKPKARKTAKAETNTATAGSSAVNAQQAAMDAELAIELEVARRLRQRMDAAAVNQQAQLVAMQQHQQQQKLQALQAPSFATFLPTSAPAWDMRAATAAAASTVGMPGLTGIPAHSFAMRGLGSEMAPPLAVMNPGLAGMIGKPTFNDPMSAALNYHLSTPVPHFGPKLHGAKSA